jgi:hypothetical protein
MWSKSIQRYYDALKRLQENEPIILPKGSKINNDTVALEAGRKRGAIKGNSPEIIELKRQIYESKIKLISKAIPKKDSNRDSEYQKLLANYKIQSAKLASTLFELQQVKAELKTLQEKNLILFKDKP